MKLFTGRFDLAHRYRQLKKIVTSQTARNSMVLFVGNIVIAVFSIAALILVSRTLGPEKFGIVATFNAIWLTISSLTDFGLGNSAVKFISSFLDIDQRQAGIYMRVIFKLELLIGAAIGVLGLLFSSQIANLLGGPHLLTAVRLAFITGLFVSAGAFFGPFLMAFEQFKKLTAVNIFGAAYRTIGVVILMSLAVLNVNSTMLFYTTVPILLFIIAILVIPKTYRVKASKTEQKQVFIKIFHFSKWIFLSSLAVVAFGRLDILLLSRLKGSNEVGLYAAAIQLTNFFPLILGAISGVLLPWVSKLKNRPDLVRYLKKALSGSILVAVLLIPIYFISEPLIHLVFGDKYADSIGAFKLIYPGYLLVIIAQPIALIFYAIDQPKMIALINYVQLLFLVVIDLVFIPRIGLYGAAAGFLVGQIVGLVMTGLLARRILKRAPN